MEFCLIWSRYAKIYAFFKQCLEKNLWLGVHCILCTHNCCIFAAFVHFVLYLHNVAQVVFQISDQFLGFLIKIIYINIDYTKNFAATSKSVKTF